mmetsp:Transcript_28653/g.77670  ORF Transcript_28653/g.77670 Transcript_28653/m.77670 type:complete len:156 (-) Transcript_28653:233-700(-)|eukprot:CAMPEP_0171187708 /NCGR_PEP_ID=MMETSP0790-20130122/17459_1 /TAXON_ID=2925 /ORGANISM="Alexandrium catenella, Strain OF101" /LENGTH=155 /DNA_ID=CAMNT_0011652775 /DNA_START=50 /DNA_END=517 /DNA_ORIENTATION=+
MTELTKRTHQEAGRNYLKGSKVGSATGYVSVAGTILGLPHGPRSRSAASPRLRFDTVSEHQHKFREMPYSYASMDGKPMSPYNPNAYRNRLAVDDAPVPFKNASALDFDNGMFKCEKRRFLTTNAVHYTGAPCDPRTNQGIISHSTKFSRSQQAK